MYTIYIDESGTLPDKKDETIVVAAVSTNSTQKISQIFKSLKKKGNKNESEIKYYTSGDKTKKMFFEKLLKENFDIFVLKIRKKNRGIADSPENFAAICWLLLRDVFSFLPLKSKVIFDKHFSAKRDIDRFNNAIQKLLSSKPIISHVDSKIDKNVNISDMVAGAVLAHETGKNSIYFDMISNKIISNKELNWIEAKRRFINKKLA